MNEVTEVGAAVAQAKDIGMFCNGHQAIRSDQAAEEG
jgi:hypothetical protein